MIRTLTLDLATELAPKLLAMSEGLEWENWTAENLLRKLPGKWELSHVAFDGETPAGYIIGSRRDGLLHIHHVIVSPGHRGGGIGRKLLQHAAKTAQESEGMDTVRLKVHRSNTGAIRLYQRLGFNITGETDELYTMMIPATALSEGRG